MGIERPTFHESWYRVTELHPKLRSTVQISRQHFRGMSWHVVQDHTNNAFFRLASPAYRFIGLLDGKRSVGEAWKIVNEHVGDDAPTQGEVIQLLGQLYMSNLLQAEVPADTQTLFSRYKKRKQREIAGYFMNIMFARVPIFDPDAFLNKWLPIFGWIFSPVGLVVWLILIAMGILSVTGYHNWQVELFDSSKSLLSPGNLILLYVAFACIKACHEMGHAISCKKFGRQSGTGGEVHVIGIMFLIFTPVPYVDASSSWALRNKWHRAIVGAAGMWVELALASIAAMVWANTSENHWVHAFAYNVMFVASFSTIVFNANPLLRYDGYYILSDLLEIPNLSQRSKDYIFYLVKRYVWNVRQARNPAHSASEQIWLFLYSIASFIMRVLVTFSIMFYLTSALDGTLIILASGMAIAGMVTWVVMPVGKFVHYLATNGELQRVRMRAVVTSIVVVGSALVFLGALPMPNHARAQGVVEPVHMAELFAGGNGFVENMPVDPGEAVRPGKDAAGLGNGLWLATLAMPEVHKGDTLFRASNQAMLANRDALFAQRDRLRAQQLEAQSLAAQNDGPNQAQVLDGQIESVNEQIALADQRLGELEFKAPIDGVLIAPALEDKKFAYIKQTDRLGVVADLHSLLVRAAVGNELEAVNREAGKRVEIRVTGRPDILLEGQIAESLPAGSNQLPSAALGYQMGGDFSTASDDRQGTKTVENFFEVRIDRIKLVDAPREILAAFKGTQDVPLLPGQRVVVRFDLPDKPLAAQAWTMLLQMFQKKFRL